MRCANEIHDNDCVIPPATCSRVIEGLGVVNFCDHCAAYVDAPEVEDDDTSEDEA